ncbi:MAG: hypothetical protein ACE5GX_00170 [Thermoanaerobaculia bacterium]
MRRFLTLVVLAVIAYYGYTELLPRYQAYQDRQEAEERADDQAGEARICVAAADSLNQDLGRGLRQFSRPPVDTGSWSTFMIQMASQLSSADSACNCPAEACRSAAAAVLEMRRLLNRFDAMARGRTAGISNPATAQERIERLLARARNEAG